MLQSAVDAEGDRYFASSDYSAAQHFLFPEQAPAPCMLRMRADEVSFDATWSTRANAPEPGLVVPGYVFNIVRIR